MEAKIIIFIEEMSSGRVTKIVYDGEVPGKSPRGRPRMRWTNNFA